MVNRVVSLSEIAPRLNRVSTIRAWSLTEWNNYYTSDMSDRVHSTGRDSVGMTVVTKAEYD